MSYVINNSRGQLIAVVPEGTVNTTSTSLSLVGQGVLNYGTAEIENYVYLLENFAAPTAPEPPVLGQLWYDSSSDAMKVWSSGNTWQILAGESYVQAQKISPAFTGVPTAPTPVSGTANTQIATTAFVTNSPQFAGVPTAPTATAGTANTQIATTAFVTNSPGFAGVPTAPTAANGTSTTQIATTAFVTSAVLSLSGNISGVLGTIASQNANAVAITGGTVTDVTLTNITDLAIADGGTGASTAANARINLGLGTMATQNANAIAITGGTITGVDISNSTGLIPSGVIVMWSGSQASIPTGWVLCNGSNSTPDLRNRFVIGAGGSYPVGDFGGNKDQAVVAHTHTASSVVNDTGHTHSVTQEGGRNTAFAYQNGPNSPFRGEISTVLTTASNTTGITVSTTVNSTGSSGLNANLPPYYALCYIMKT